MLELGACAMGGWKKGKRINSMQYRVLISALSVIFVVAILILAIYFSVSVSNIENEYTFIVQASLHNIDLSFSQVMENISTECITLYNSIEGTKVRLVPDYIPTHAVKITNDLRNSFNLFPFIHSVYMIDKNNDVVLNVTNNFSNTIQNADAKIKEELEARETSSGWIIWSAKKKYTNETVYLLSNYFRSMYPGKKFYQGTCVINVDLSAFSKSFFNEIQDENTAFYIINSDGIVIAQSGSGAYGAQTPEILNTDRFTSLISQSKDTKITGRKSNELYSIESTLPGYYIIAVGDYHQQRAAATGRVIRTGLIVLLIFTVSAGVLYLLYLRIFKPFNSIVDTAQKNLIRESGKKDIDVLRSYYKELSDSIDELKEKEDKNSIVKMLLKDAEVNQMMIDKGFLNSQDAFYAVFIHIGAETKFDRQLLEYEKLRNCFISCFIQELNQYGNSIAYDIGFRKIMILVGTSPEASALKKKITDSIIQKQLSLADEYDCYITSFVSELKNAASSSILELYRKSENCIRTRRYLDDKQPSIVIKENINEEKVSSMPILEHLKSGRRDTFSKTLYNWLETNKNSPWDWFYNELITLATNIINIRNINESKTNIPQILENALDNLRGTEDIINWFLKLYDDAFSVIKSVNDYSMISLMEEAISYIDDHYGDPDLNLSTLANSLHISAPYLGKNFRRFTGVGFTDYLNKIRMEHAKTLLLDNSGSVSEIAKKVGYLNNAYFTTSFKNYYGMPPSKFKAYCNSQNQQK